jgi:Lar family restriction alleviation protein
MSELKPCPFCGGEAGYEEFYYDRPFMAVFCTKCGSQTSMDDRPDNFTKEEAAILWNNRPPEFELMMLRNQVWRIKEDCEAIRSLPCTSGNDEGMDSMARRILDILNENNPAQ